MINGVDIIGSLLTYVFVFILGGLTGIIIVLMSGDENDK